MYRVRQEDLPFKGNLSPRFIQENLP